MPLSIFRSVSNMPLIPHIGLVVATIFGFRWIKGTLDASYAASKHPVDYFTGQTRFSGTQIKEYYATMQGHGTLDVYHTTQMIDFGFIIAIFCMGLFFCTLISRLGRPDSWGRTFGLTAGLAVATGAVCDAIENLISFVMLANPQDFSDWIALPYSGFAAIKFGLITLGMLLLVLSILSSLFGRIINKPAIG